MYDGSLPAVHAKYPSTAYSGRTVISASIATAMLLGISSSASSAPHERIKAAANIDMPNNSALRTSECVEKPAKIEPTVTSIIKITRAEVLFPGVSFGTILSMSIPIFWQKIIKNDHETAL